MPESEKTDPGARGRLRGEVIYLYAFDVANEIRLERAAERLAARPAPLTGRAAREAMPTARPLEVEAALAVRLAGRPVRQVVHVYEVGVVCVALRVAFEATTLADLAAFHRAGLDDGRLLGPFAREVCAGVCHALADARVKPSEPTAPEGYRAFRLTELGGEADANRWMAAGRRAVAGLLADAGPGRLSDAQVDEALRLHRSFEHTDLVVVDWGAALVVDLAGTAEDALFVLELASVQLEEFRWLDRTLDRYLDRAYSELSRPRWPLGTGSGAALRSLRRLRIDLARLADEATHVTKFIGDWHLARVHQLARERFHLDQWRGSVEQRLGQLDHLYTLAHGELYERRMLWLEAAIVLLFVIDLLALFVWRG